MSYVKTINEDGVVSDIMAKALDPTLYATLLRKSELLNGFTQTTAGVKALDAVAGKTLNDILGQCGGLVGGAVLKENTDLNTITTPGVYSVLNSNSGSYHFPSGANGILVVVQFAVNVWRQFFFRIGTPNSTDMFWYTRTINTGTVGNWQEIVSNTTIRGGGTTYNISKFGNVVNLHLVAATSLPTAAEITAALGTDDWKPYATIYTAIWNYPSGSSGEMAVLSVGTNGTVSARTLSNATLSTFRFYGEVVWITD